MPNIWNIIAKFSPRELGAISRTCVSIVMFNGEAGAIVIISSIYIRFSAADAFKQTAFLRRHICFTYSPLWCLGNFISSDTAWAPHISRINFIGTKFVYSAWRDTRHSLSDQHSGVHFSLARSRHIFIFRSFGVSSARFQEYIYIQGHHLEFSEYILI